MLKRKRKKKYAGKRKAAWQMASMSEMEHIFRYLSEADEQTMENFLWLFPEFLEDYENDSGVQKKRG